MQTFPIEEYSQQTAKEHIKSKGRKPHLNGHAQKEHGKQETEEEVRNNLHNAAMEWQTDPLYDVIKYAACNSEQSTNEKIIYLLSHLKIFFKLPFAPYLTEITSPLAAKFPLPSEKESTFKCEPLICTRFPFTVSAIAESVKESTEETPVIVILLCCSIVRTLCLISSRIVHRMLVR